MLLEYSPDIYRFGVQTGGPYPGTVCGKPRESHCAFPPEWRATSCENNWIASLQSEILNDEEGPPKGLLILVQEGRLLQLYEYEKLRADDGVGTSSRAAGAATAAAAAAVFMVMMQRG